MKRRPQTDEGGKGELGNKTEFGGDVPILGEAPNHPMYLLLVGGDRLNMGSTFTGCEVLGQERGRKDRASQGDRQREIG